MLLQQGREKLPLENQLERQKLDLESQIEELMLMQPKRQLQLKVDIECAAAKEAVYESADKCLSNPGPSRKDTFTRKEKSIPYSLPSQCQLYCHILDSNGQSQARFSNSFLNLSEIQKPPQPQVTSVPQPQPISSKFNWIKSTAFFKVPPADVSIFNGKPIRYCYFINAFKTIIKNKKPDSHVKAYIIFLNTLMEWLIIL